MAKIDYTNLEKNTKLRRFYINKVAWWKNFSMVSPILLIFIGVVGLVYYSNAESLYSWHTLPYAIAFAFGIILLLYVKSSLKKKFLNNKDSFLCCASYLIEEYQGYGYYVYSTTNKYSESWIEKQGKDLTLADFSEEQTKQARKQSVSVKASDDTQLSLRAISLAKLHKEYRTKTTPTKIVLLYITDKYCFPVKDKFLNK